MICTNHTVGTLKNGAVTFDHFQMVGNLLQDGETGQDQAEGATQAWPWAALWLVPLAALR